jgi:hypothetical protein
MAVTLPLPTLLVGSSACLIMAKLEILVKLIA